MNKIEEFELQVSSNKISFKKLNEFLIGLKINNNNHYAVSFDISDTELFVNNKKNVSWDLAVQNGTIINLIIPPNKSKTVMLPLGEAIFHNVGNYELKLVWNSQVKKRHVVVSE